MANRQTQRRRHGAQAAVRPAPVPTRSWRGGILLLSLLAAGCSSTPPLYFTPDPELRYEKGGARLFPGRLGFIPLRDDRTLPFDVESGDDDHAYFGRGAVTTFDESLQQTLTMGNVAGEIVELRAEDPLLEPDHEALKALSAQYPDLDFVLSGSVQMLNVSTQFMAASDISVGNMTYRNLAYYAQRLRIRVHLELYSLKYNQLLWGDVIEGLAHEAQHKKATQSLLAGAYTQFTHALHASLVNSATIASLTDDGSWDLAEPEQSQLIEASVAKARLRQTAMAGDYDRVHREGQQEVQRQAKKLFQAQVNRVQFNKAFAGLLNTTMVAMAKHKGMDPSQITLVDLTQFDEQLRQLGADTGSSIVSIDVEGVIDDLVNYDPIEPEDKKQSVRVIGAEFQHYATPRFDILAQVNAAKVDKLAFALEQTLDTYIEAYGDRQDLARIMAQREHRIVICAFRRRQDFKEWCKRWNGPADSGGFHTTGNPRLLDELARAGFAGQQSLIALFWYGYHDQDGDPVSAVRALWSTIPHEVGHHIHDILLNGRVPPFQSDGFTQFHEYPIDFAGKLRFGQWVNPKNHWYLGEMKQNQGVIPLEAIVTMTYKQISAGGTNSQGYRSVWLYYQFFKRHRPSELAEFERRLATSGLGSSWNWKQQQYAAVQQLFLEAFRLPDHDAVAKLGAEAEAWVKGQNISAAELTKAEESYLSVSQMAPRAYNHRATTIAEQPQ